MITPLTPDGVDYAAFGKLIDWQIAEGIDALVICGTTGESSTLTDEEHREVIRYGIERVAGRVPVIAGTGSNDTQYAIELTQYAASVGADAALVGTELLRSPSPAGRLAELLGRIREERRSE